MTVRKEHGPIVDDDSLLVSTPRACRVLDIGSTLLYRLIDHGILERVFVCGASRITTASLRRVADTGVPRLAKPPKPAGARPRGRPRRPPDQPGIAAS